MIPPTAWSLTLHEFACDVIDGRELIGVNSMPQRKCIGEQ
jgi:hypothetical protein